MDNNTNTWKVKEHVRRITAEIFTKVSGIGDTSLVHLYLSTFSHVCQCCSSYLSISCMYPSLNTTNNRTVMASDTLSELPFSFNTLFLTHISTCLSYNHFHQLDAVARELNKSGNHLFDLMFFNIFSYFFFCFFVCLLYFVIIHFRWQDFIKEKEKRQVMLT